MIEEVSNDVKIRFMKRNDLDRVLLIEQLSFPTPWAVEAYLSELNNDFASYFVLTDEEEVVGYTGMWLFAGESHVTTIAIHPDCRSRGYGRLLLLYLIEYSILHGADTMILEVRVSNEYALKLYSSMGFNKIGIRRNYYKEIGEDAIVMRKHLK